MDEDENIKPELEALHNFIHGTMEGFASEYTMEELIGVCNNITHWRANVGHRSERIQHNPREKAFHDEWLKENEPKSYIDHGHGLLQDLFIESDGSPMFGRKCVHVVTENERMVAATAIQWLGTNCGMAFLYEVLKKFNARIVYDEPTK